MGGERGLTGDNECAGRFRQGRERRDLGLLGVVRHRVARIGLEQRVGRAVGEERDRVAHEVVARGLLEDGVGGRGRKPDRAAEERAAGDTRGLADLVARDLAVEAPDDGDMLQRIDHVEQGREEAVALGEVDLRGVRARAHGECGIVEAEHGFAAFDVRYQTHDTGRGASPGPARTNIYAFSISGLARA